LVDENLPRELAARLHAAGYVAEHVIDAGLRGHSDAEVYAYAQAEGATLITIDTGFGNLLQYPSLGLGVRSFCPETCRWQPLRLLSVE
jgi:predicted nuclease of predicted toxin-antitoxin system